jgi:hypothetical protein
LQKFSHQNQMTISFHEIFLGNFLYHVPCLLVPIWHQTP